MCGVGAGRVTAFYWRPDANEALERAKHHDGLIQLMLTDLGLPDADGRNLAAWFSHVRPEAKIMFMSGSIILEPATTGLFLTEAIRTE